MQTQQTERQSQKQIQNALNKIRVVSGTSIDAKGCVEVLECILGSDLPINHVAVFNSSSGMICRTLEMFGSFTVASVATDYDAESIENFKSIDLIQVNQKFEGSFEMGIIEPTLAKKGRKDTEWLPMAMRTCKNVILITDVKNKEGVLQKYSSASPIGSMNLKLQGSSNYHKNENKETEHIVILIKNISKVSK